jgi:phasin family protein
MTPFSDQLSAVRQAQWQAQLDMFSKLTSRALDSAGQLAELNMRASRATMEQAAGTVKHMLEVRDPRDLFALGTAAQGQWQAVFSYGRELFGLAVGARALQGGMPLLATAPTANVPTTYSQVMEQASIATADAATITGKIAAAAVDIGAAHAEAAIDAGTQRTQAEAVIETAIADDVPPAEPTPLARAVSEVAPKPAGAERPLAAAVALQADRQVDLPPVAPVENAAPPPKASRGPRRK